MAASLLAGAAVGAVFGELLKAVLESKNRAQMFRPTLERLESTLMEIEPVIKQIDEYNEALDQPKEEIEGLIKQMEKGKKIVQKCMQIGWWGFLLKGHYQDQVSKLDKSLVRFFKVNMQAHMARDQKKTLLELRGVHEEVSKLNLALRNVRVEMKSLCAVPEPPDFTVGLDMMLKQLKTELLKSGSSKLVLTASGGSGKTTIAKKLCWDEEVAGKFKENILFVTFSKMPNLKIIIQKLFQHSGHAVPEFQSDEDAVNQLGYLMKEIGKNPVLLVFDDVWSGSESLLEKFVFQITDYKILVTSRFTFFSFGTHYYLKPLGVEDAMTLFRYSASLLDDSSNIPADTVRKIVRECRGSPLALTVIGRSLCQQPAVVWQNRVMEWSRGHSILDSSTDLLDCLKKSLDVLSTKPIMKECFMDLGLFPEDQRIPADAFIDTWAELHKFDEEGVTAMSYLYELTNRNMANIVLSRKLTNDTENYYNDYFVMQHDLLRELAIHQSCQEPVEQRKRLILDISGNNLPVWWAEHNLQPITARILSISTDEMFTSDWCNCNVQAPSAEVLVLNLQSKKYALPDLIEKMSILRVLIVTNYGFCPTELENIEVLGSLSNLRRIRMEKVYIPSLSKTTLQFKKLQKLSLFMCHLNHAFDGFTNNISDALPNVVEINIDYCDDIVELPAGICNIFHLKKLSITNCHKLSGLPEKIGNLVDLKVLRLSSCTDLAELPESFGNLHNLHILDISDCVNLCKLPEHIGELQNLRKLYMRGCLGLSELPSSVSKLEELDSVVCDEEIALLWEYYKPFLSCLNIEVPKPNFSLNWLHRSLY